jgi:predicted ArsR family transcriptional regulator
VLALSEVAVRRHLALLETEELILGETVRRGGPGRPGTVYRTTDRAARLFPDGTADFANELLDYLEDRLGPGAVQDFLRWRQARVAERYAGELSALESQGERVETLADLLTEDGFPSLIEAVDGSNLALTQGHCAIREVAQAHPEICQLEAEMFEDLLGVAVSRERTLALGASQCVCEIPISAPPQPAAPTEHARARSDRDQ